MKVRKQTQNSVAYCTYVVIAKIHFPFQCYSRERITFLPSAFLYFYIMICCPTQQSMIYPHSFWQFGSGVKQLIEDSSSLWEWIYISGRRLAWCHRQGFWNSRLIPCKGSREAAHKNWLWSERRRDCICYDWNKWKIMMSSSREFTESTAKSGTA